MVHFLRCARRQVAAPGVGFQQDVVAQHVQFLLRLALHVAGTGIAQHAAQRALADGDGDAGAGARDHRDQLAQFGVDAAGALFLDQVAGQGDGLHGVWITVFSGRNAIVAFPPWHFDVVVAVLEESLNMVAVAGSRRVGSG
ncbi:hypothetical protein FQZ97_1129890 [compost metagenome]